VGVAKNVSMLEARISMWNRLNADKFKML